MYEPSRVLLSFHIAGFQYADGALVLGDLKAGDKLTLCAERDNPHDPEAVAIYYGKTKLGYVPGNEVGPLSLMMYYGHEDVFEARLQQVAPPSAARGTRCALASMWWMPASRQWRRPCLMTTTSSI